VYLLIGKLVADARKSRIPALTQHQLAELTGGGITRSALANIERGRQRIAIHQLYHIAKALQLEPSDLLPPPERVALDVSTYFGANRDIRQFTEAILGNFGVLASPAGRKRGSK
jgi:transcriptional regulator with XRE-family HTH domain